MSEPTIPLVPIETVPGGFLSQADAERLITEALTALGVELGAYDRRIVSWQAGWDATTVVPLLSWLHRAAAELEAAPRTVYRAEYRVAEMTLDTYSTPAAARAHCEAVVLREQPTASLDWIEDEEDGIAELEATVDGVEWVTGYVVTALVVAAEYDAEADE